MPRQFVLLICLAFVAWLFVRDRKLRPMTSGYLWLPILWFLIITSRPVSLWFGGGWSVKDPKDYLDGSPFDRNVYLLLLVLGVGVLFRRSIQWKRFYSVNPWVVALFLYWGISVVWSDFAFVGLKRWIKDVGNVVMVLVLLTERDPVQAFRAFMARSMYVAVPFSVAVIKYYGEVGRYVTSTWDNAFCGIATEKNALGLLALLSGIFLVWDYAEGRDEPSRKRDKLDVMSRVLLLLMVFWLIQKANSSTALVCLIMGSFLVVVMRTQIARRLIAYLGTYALVAASGIVLFLSVPGLLEMFLEMLGEDLTLTGRTELWGQLMAEKLNPLLGTGYQSFWLGPRAEVYWERWSFHPNQAHNGYLETYLNGGWIALGFLVMLLVSSGARLKKRLMAGGSFARVLFAYFVVIIFYNWTEAMFNKMTPIWFIQLLTAVVYPKRHPLRPHSSPAKPHSENEFS